MPEETSIYDVDAEEKEPLLSKYDHYATCPHCNEIHNIGWPDSPAADEIEIECECGNRFIYSPYKGVRK